MSAQRLLSIEASYFVPVFFGAGIALYFYHSTFSLWLMLSLMCLFLWGSCFDSRWHFLRGANIFAALFCAGYAWISIRTLYQPTFFLKEPIYEAKLSGVVQSVELLSKTQGGYQKNEQRVVIQVQDDPLLKKVRLRVDKDTELVPGQRICFQADLKPLCDKITPYSFDMKRDAFYKGINATGRITEVFQKDAPKSQWIERMRHKISKNIRANIHSEAKELAVALTVGDKNGISQETRNYFADSGTSHILAISGLHLSVIALFLIALFQIVASFVPVLHERLPMYKITPCIAWVFLLFYSLLSGSGYPVQRAFIMLSLMVVGILIDRRTVSLYSVCIAAFLLLVIFPESMINVSFQLSFAAVIPIIALYEKHQFSAWLSPIISTITASLGTLPFSIMIFKYTTLQAVTGNLLVVPFFSYLIMPFTLLSFFGVGLPVLEFLLKVLIMIVKFVSHLKWAHIAIPATTGPYFLLLFVTGGLILCLIQNRLRFLGLIPMVLAPFFYFPAHAPDRLESTDGRVVAWRVEPNVFHTESKNRFVLDEWERVYAIKIRKVSN